METRFLPLLLVVLLAMFVPLLLARLRRIPVVVGEILAGIIIGPSVLGLVSGHEPTLDVLGEIGFAFLMFLSGLEIDFSILYTNAKQGVAHKELHDNSKSLKPLFDTIISEIPGPSSVAKDTNRIYQSAT